MTPKADRERRQSSTAGGALQPAVLISQSVELTFTIVLKSKGQDT